MTDDILHQAGTAAKATDPENLESDILHAPNLQQAAGRALVNIPTNEDDYDARVRAKTLSEALGKAIAIAKRDSGKNEGDTPEEADHKDRVQADAIGAILSGRHDYYGSMWNGRKPFATGAEYAQHMRNLALNGPSVALSDEFKEFYKADYETQCRIAEEKELGVTDVLKELYQDATGAIRATPHLSRHEMSFADEETRNASYTLQAGNAGGGYSVPKERYDAAEKKILEFREQRRREEIRARYEAKLNRENAWNALTTILPTLSEDARQCAKAILDSDNNALPVKYYAKFNGLSERERNLLIQTRQLSADRIDSGFWNTIEDALIGGVNITGNIFTAPIRQGAKFIAMAKNGAKEPVEAGIDVNNIAITRQLLWQATGNPFAGGDLKTGQLPQLQFERVCDEHGVVGEAVIGAISTLPYMAAAMIPYAGPALIATEAMQEMDDHVALNGGDITNPGYIVSSFVLGGLYAYVEKLQVEKLIGGVSEQGVREGLLKGFYAGIKNGTVPRVLITETLSESLQEGLQNGIAAINTAYALKEDAVRSFGEAFVDDFIGSLGTMTIIGAGGIVLGHMGRSGWHFRGTDGKSAALLRQEERSTDLTNIYLAEFAHNNMVELSGRSDEYRLAQLQKQQQSLFEFWKKGGKDGLIENAGISDKAADNLDRLFTAMREAEGATAKANEALQEWNRGRGVTSAPKSGEAGDIGQQYLEQLIGGAIRGEISEEDFVARLMDLGFSARGARDYATLTTLENGVITEQAAIQSFLQGRYEREAGSKDARNADYEKVKGAIRDLDKARSVWARGFGIYRREEDGKTVDPGAAALEKFGFTKADAERLSKLFHYERAAAFSPIALDGIRAMYERATRGKVSAKAAIASEFRGRVVRLSTGTDAKGRPVYGDFIRFTRNGQTGYVQILDSKTGAPDFSEGNVLVAESIAEATKHKKTPITVQQWMDATPAERENLWNQYHLYDEGFFTEMTPTELTVAADPSARVDSEQAKILLYGTITLATDPSFSGDRRTLDTIRTVDSSAGFHEVYHAWSYFMQQTGKWSEKDDEELQKKYGRAPSGGHNEEATANALRAYINRRIEGRMTGEDEKSPFAKIFALARRLLRHAEEKAIKARAAATAEEAFFDQIMADNFTGVGEISKQPEAPKPVENAKTSTPTYPPSEASSVAGAMRGAPQMPGLQSGAPASMPESAEAKQTAEPVKQTAASVKQTAASVKQTAAQRGWSAYTPTGNVKVGGHYAVVNLSEVIHSNNPAYALYMRAQLRNRKDNKAEEDTRKDIVNNFQGERLLEAPDTANGAPIVFIAPDEKGVKRMFVLSGNGRILVLNELAERHMYDKYRNVMKAWAAENGLEVPEGETPVLVRVITDYGGATREKIADLSNTNSIQQYTEEEQARADAEIIKSLGIARLYHANMNGSPDMTPGVNDDFFAEFIRGVGDTSLYNSDRSLTETARIRAVRALLAITVGQGERGRDVVKKLIEQTDTLNIVRQKNAAAIMAAAVASLETNDDYSIGPDVSRAMADYIDFAEKKKTGKIGTFDEYFAQMDLLDGPSEIAREILKLFGSRESAADIAEYVNKYCEAASQSDPTGGLLGSDWARTRIQIWNDAVRTVDEQRGKNTQRHSISSENYGVGSSAANGPGFVDLAPGDTFGAIEEHVKSLVDEKVPNDSLGIVATIGSKSNANHLATKMSSLGDEQDEAHKYAVKNILPLFAKSNIGIVHHDKKGSKNDYIRAFTPFSFGGSQYAATITLRRDNGGDKLYTVEAVEIENAEGSPRSSDHKDRQGAQPSVSLRDRITYYVGDVNRTQPKFIGRVSGEAFAVEKLLSEIESEMARNRRPVRHSISGVDFEAVSKYYDGGVRDIARRLKDGDENALRIAAASMARAIRPGDVLIPVPSHDGRAHDTLLLADAISRITGSPVVEAIRGTVRNPIYDLKARGYLPDAEDLGFYRAADIPEDRRAVFIDNVVGTGTTAVAARQALGRGHVVAFAWDHTAPHPVGIVGGLTLRHSITADESIQNEYESPAAYPKAAERYSFAIGEVGAANLQDALFTAANLKMARELLAGRDWAKIPRPERIRIKFATGWEVGADGKWRMEKPDLPPISLKKFKRVAQPGSPASMPEPTAADEGAATAEYEPITLGKLFPKAELFSSYPWLKSTKVLLGALPQDESTRGSYNEDSDEIKLRFGKTESAETIHATLVHEIQHAIQRIEDFARGGNLGIAQKIFMERFKKAKEEARPLYREELNLADRYLPWNERYKYTGWPKRHPERIAALEKLRTFEEYCNWERRAADFKKKWKRGIDFFVKSDFTAMRLAFNSSHKDYTKLAGEVEARNASTRHYKTILDLRGAYAAKPDFPVLLEDTEDVDRRYQTLLNGAMEQFEKLKSQEDRDARHSFAGLRAANLAGVTPLADAETLENRGEDRETIFKLTGWWRGVDGLWRVELPFHGRFELEGDFDQGMEKGYRTLSDYFDWPELFSSYPELRDVEVQFEDMLDDVRGNFDPKTKTIKINKSLRKESANIPAKLKVAAVMIHEIQHAIQSIENHARGGDPEQFLTWDATKIHDEIRRLELQRELTDDADEKESIDEMIQEHEFALQSDAEDAERKYYSLAGEVEARNAAERFFDSPAYRLANPPWTTQDTFDNQQILDFEPDGAQWSATYDDAGRIIPDSRRLDWENGDIRYSIQTWPENFPKVKIVTTLDLIKRKYEDLHKRAKAGSLGAAMDLVNAIIGPATIKGKPNPKWESIRSLAADYPGATLVPMLAEEATGHNMIPYAYARKIREITGMKYVATIRQVVRANHAGADAFWRMTHRPEFIGNIMRGRAYIIVDDHVTMGGTLSELRKHIQDRGGKVVATTTLTASRFSDILSLRQGTLEKLAAKFGKNLGKELHEAGIANVPAELTEAEARYLLRLSPDTLRDRLNGSALERRTLGSLAEGSVQARGVRSTILPGAAGGMGNRANGSSGSGRSSASHVNDFPGFSEYKDPNGNFGPTRWAKAEIFNGRISKELNKVIDDALVAGNLPGKAKLEELTKLIERAKATKEGKLVLERYKTGDSFDGSDAQKNDPKRQAIWRRIRQELILDPISSVNNEGLAIDKKTGKPKNASTIEASNAANPELPAIANDATASYDPICDQRLDIVIGPPAAGKSSVFVDRLSIYYRSRVMDSDAIKQRLPGFDKGNGASFVHEESSYVNKMLLAELLEANKGENIVLPIVGSTAKKIRSYIDMFRNRGYAIYLHNNYVPIVHAFARALVRTTSTGRWIAPEVFLDCLDRPSAAFEEIKDEVDGWDEFSNDVPLGMEPIPARGNYKDPAYGTIEFAGEKIEAPSDIKVTPQLVFDFANALDLDKATGAPIFPVHPTQETFDFGDTESRSRHAIRSDLQENANKAAEEALTNYLTYFRLSHSGEPRANTIARMGLAMGMNIINPKRLLDKAESRAEQVRGTLIEKAAANGDVATTLALLKRENQADEAVEKLIAGGISKGGELTHKGVGQINSIIGKRVEQMMRDFTAASLADMEGETGLDLAAEILEHNPDAFADEVKKTKGTDPDKPQEDEGSDTDIPGGDAGDESGLSDYERHKRAVAREAALKKVEAFIAAAKARAAKNKAKAEERRKHHDELVNLPGDGNGQGSDGEAGLPRGDQFDSTPKNVKANFKSKEEFAAFMRVWAEHKFDETHGISTLGKTERDKLFAEFYRITVREELQDLADKLLAPKDENGVTISRIAKLGNGARVHVNRRLAEMEKGVRPDTIERMSADIFAFINSAAIRVSRTDLVKEFKKRIRDGYIKGAKYEDLKLDADRRVTGWVEEAARYICRVCDLSKREINGLPSQLAAERKELHDIINRRADVYDESGREVAKAAVEDMETKKAMWKLALLDKYGAMTALMPGEILDLQNQAIEYLDKQAADLERLWRDTRAYEEGIRRDLTAAIVAPGGQRYKEKGWLDGRLFDALNGLIRLRLQHLTRFASDADRQKASEAINKIIVMLGDGETQYNRALQDDRRALFEGLGRIFQKPEGGVDNVAIKKYLDRMTEPIPKALARQISNQGFADSMTYGQMLQLLVSLEQRSFREAIEHNGRQGQADLIRNFETTDENGVKSKVFTAEDNQFVEWLRAFYAAKRDVISPVTLRMVGQRVDSPDPLYCPVKRSMEDRVQALAEAGSSWDPIAAVFTRRIRNNRDFDEQASVIGMFFDRSDETARLLAWAERGTVIRGVFTSVGVQSAIRRAFGPGELRKIMTQLLATFNGGESRKKSPGELAAVDKALNFTTYAYLGFNPLSAIKQTTSFTVWANALPGGFRDLWKYMSHFDRAALKHLKESDEYKLRYGNDVGSGQDLATKGLNENPGMNPVARMLSGAGMWLLKKGDFAPGGWIAQGLYKDILNKHLNEGMEFDAADRLAITETFNMLEETQQSGRTYNTNMLTIEHGRIGRLLTQFATSPLQQLQYETQAYREWRDMKRYNMGEKKIAAARRKLMRAVVINHLLLPAALNFVTAMFKLAMGDEPPWEKDGYHWSILTDVLMGQFSRVFFIGTFSQTALKALFMREYPRGSQMLPVEGTLGMAASLCITAHDVATLNAENIRKDFERMLKATAPTRIPYGIYRRLVGDSDLDRKRAKKGAGKK